MSASNTSNEEQAINSSNSSVNPSRHDIPTSAMLDEPESNQNVLDLYTAALRCFENLLDSDHFDYAIQEALRLDNLLLKLRLWRADTGSDNAIFLHVQKYNLTLALQTKNLLRIILELIGELSIHIASNPDASSPQYADPLISNSDHTSFLMSELSSHMDILSDLAAAYRGTPINGEQQEACELYDATIAPEPDEIDWNAFFTDEGGSFSVEKASTGSERAIGVSPKSNSLQEELYSVFAHDALPLGAKPSLKATRFMPIEQVSKSQGQPTHDQSGSIQKCSCSARRKQTVLTLDGGGIRSYSSLLLLKHIMTLCVKSEHKYDELEELGDGQEIETALPLPCHYFDYMFGTSSGGLLAIMLGRLRMSIDDCIANYTQLGGQVFNKPNRLQMLRSKKYSANRMEHFLQDLIKRNCPDNSNQHPTFLQEPGLGTGVAIQSEGSQRYIPCRVAVLAVRKTAKYENLYMIRSYHNPTQPNIRKDLGKLLNLTNQGNFKIWEAARATSAAPTFFSPVNVDGLQFVDGGLEANNPSSWAWREVESMHLNDPSGKCTAEYGGIHQMISLGAGTSPEAVWARRFSRNIPVLARSSSTLNDPEPIHNHMARLAEKFSTPVYFRFNVNRGLEDTKLDGFQYHKGAELNFGRITDAVEQYISQPGVKESLEKVAERLVQHRRSRCKPGVWRKYRGLTEPGPLQEKYLEKFQWDNTTTASRFLRGVMASIQEKLNLKGTIWVYNYNTSTTKKTNAKDLLSQVGNYGNIKETRIPLKPGKVPILAPEDSLIVARIDISYELRVLRWLGIQKDLYIIDDSRASDVQGQAANLG